MKHLIFFVILFRITTIYAINTQELNNSIKEFITQKIVDIDSISLNLNSKKINVKKISSIQKINLISRNFFKTSKFRLKYIDTYGNIKYSIISYNIAIYKKIPFAKIKIKKNTPIKQQSIFLKSTDITLTKNYIKNINDLNNKIAKTDIKRNSNLRYMQIKEKNAIEKFSKIKVILNNSNVKISFKAIALESGKIKDKILFKSSIDQKIKKGTIIATNIVEYKI